MKTLTRRQFGRVTGSGLFGVIVLGGCGGRVTMSRVPLIGEDELGVSRAALRDALHEYFERSDLEIPATLGDKLSAEHDDEALRERIVDGAQVVADTADATAAADRWHALVAADFEDGDIESLAGWQLSPTELTLCLLSAVALDDA